MSNIKTRMWGTTNPDSKYRVKVEAKSKTIAWGLIRIYCRKHKLNIPKMGEVIEISKIIKCPVCGKEVYEHHAKGIMHLHRHYLVCSTKCMWDFYK